MEASRSGKKLLVLYILEILKRYSHESQRLTQSDIIKYLKKDFGVECDRKTVARNIDYLIEFGYEIDSPRDGKKGYVFLNRDFEEGELRMLIDSVLAFRYIPETYARDLVKKLVSQASEHFKNRTRHIHKVGEWPHFSNKDIFLNLDLIDEAIERKRKITFIYNDYGLDKKLHPRREERYLVNPYQMILHNQRYYLILNVDKYDNLSCYRIDQITDIEITDMPVKKLSSVKGCKNGIDLGKISTQHPYMFLSTGTEQVVLKSHKSLIGDFLDWFGPDMVVEDLGNDEIRITLKASIGAMRYWALQYGPNVEVLAPQKLRDMICEDLKEMCRKYL